MTPPPAKSLDTITLRNLHTTCCIGPDAWGRAGKQQPIYLTLRLALDTEGAGAGDDLARTWSYGVMAKEIMAGGKGVGEGTLSGIEGGQFASMTALTNHITSIAEGWPGERLQVVAVAPKALLRVEGGLSREVVLVKKGNGGRRWCVDGCEWGVSGLKVACIVGVNAHERLERQGVVVELGIEGGVGDEKVWRELVRGVCEVVDASTFQTLEALAARIAETCLRHEGIPRIRVLVEKPSALAAVDGAGVEIVRDRQWMLNRERRA